MKNAVLTVLLIAAATVAQAGEHSSAMEALLKQLSISVHNSKATPAIFSEVTTAGGEHFAGEWLKKTHGDVIGGELGDDYIKQNESSVETQELIDRKLPIERIERVEGEIDWPALEKRRPGVRSVIYLSRPGFDSLNSVAVVRADIVRRDGVRTTAFFTADRQPNGTWSFVRASFGGTPMMHSKDTHVHTEEEASLYH